MSKRYRYILCGVVTGDDKISDFRLIAGNTIKPSYNGYSAIRVTIPADLEITKYSSDSYSTTDDARKLDSLGYDILIWNSGQRKWIINNQLKGLNPCEFPI